VENEIVKIEAQQLERITWNDDEIQLIKDTVAKGTDDLQFKLFLYQAKRTGLDPLAKQIHAVLRYNDQSKKHDMAIQTGIDGYRLTADRTKCYAGSDEPKFIEGNPYPTSCTVTIYKIVGGVRCPFTATAFWKEYYPGDSKAGFFWRKMPHGQLAKCAEALALRKGFPAELSGVYTHEEMQQSEGIVTNYEDVTVKLDGKEIDKDQKQEPEQEQKQEPKKEITYPPNLQKLIAAMMNNAAKLPELFKKDVREIVARKTELTDAQLVEWLAAIDFHLTNEAAK